MNWKKIDEVWKAFANKNHLSIEKSSEQIFLHSTQTTYQITLHEEEPIIELKGNISKSAKGLNDYHTILLIKNIEIPFFKFQEVLDRRILGLFKINYKDLNKARILKLIRDFGAKKIIKTKTGFKIFFDFPFDNEEDFKMALKLAEKLVRLSGKYVNLTLK